jgi:hypothetical protein
VAADLDAARCLGYAPASLPADVEYEDRYDHLYLSETTSFTFRDCLHYWRDIAAAQIQPTAVGVLGIGGGDISVLELHLATAFGATVLLSAEPIHSSTLVAARRWFVPTTVTPQVGELTQLLP